MSRKRAVWRRLLDGWMVIAARFGEVQTLVLLSLVYALVIGPVGVGASLTRRDFLNKSGIGQEGSAFSEADTVHADLERAKQPF